MGAAEVSPGRYTVLTMSRKKSALDKIVCPRQRAVAARIGDLGDLFSSTFRALPYGERLTLEGAAVDGPTRVRAAMRMFLVGAVFALGKSLGLPGRALRGGQKGRTEIVDLRVVHYQTILSGHVGFEGLCHDAGEIGQLVAARFRAVRAQAVADVCRWTTPDDDTGAAEWLRSRGFVWADGAWQKPI